MLIIYLKLYLTAATVKTNLKPRQRFLTLARWRLFRVRVITATDILVSVTVNVTYIIE